MQPTTPATQPGPGATVSDWDNWNTSQATLGAQQAASGALNMPAGTHTDAPGTGYDMTNPNTTALLSKTYGITPDQLQQIGAAYQAQYGQNIGTDALMRAVNESSGNYLWGPTPGQTVAQTQAAHPGATVTDPKAINQLPFGTAQNGAYTPNAGVAVGTPGSVPIAPNSAITAPLTHNPLAQFVAPTSPNDFKSSMANTTNLINQTGGGATAGLLNQSGGTPTAGGSSTQALSTAAGAVQNPFDLLQARESALGIPAAQTEVSGLRQAVTNTTNLLNKIAPSVEGRTADSLVNEAQANKMIQNEQAPVQANLTSLGQQVNDSQSALTNLLAQANNEATMQGQGQEQAFNNANVVQQAQAAAQAAQQAQANFMLQQAQAAEQFQQNLALQVAAQQITKDAAAEQTREFNATQSQQAAQFQQQEQDTANALAASIANNNAQNALAAQSNSISASKASSSSTPSVAQSAASNAQAISSKLTGSQGSDHYVSPGSWNTAKSDWITNGGTSASFNSAFSYLKNPYYASASNNTGLKYS